MDYLLNTLFSVFFAFGLTHIIAGIAFFKVSLRVRSFEYLRHQNGRVISTMIAMWLAPMALAWLTQAVAPGRVFNGFGFLLGAMSWYYWGFRPLKRMIRKPSVALA